MIGEALTALKAIFGSSERSYLIDEYKQIVEFDVVESESWSASTNVTSYAVENGDSVSDHIKVNPTSVSLNATITNHTGISVLDPISLLRIQGASDVQDVAREKLEQLEQWRKNGTLLTYVGAVKDAVENCVITSISPSKSSGTGDAIELSINLQKVVIAQYVETQIGLPQSAKSVNQKGQVPTKSSSVSLSTNNSSISSMFKNLFS